MKESVFETGAIKKYSIANQHGFIRRADGEEVFFHHSSIVYMDNGNCNHSSLICARATGLVPRSYGEITIWHRPEDIERMLIDARVKFTVDETPRGKVARHIKRAE